MFNKCIYSFQLLEKHQKDKLKYNNNIVNIFIGDSSLGNSINAKLYGEISGLETLNLSLTGLHGFAGTYNFLKRAKKNYPNLKNIYIMHTLDMFNRKISYQGYMLTSESAKDYDELCIEKKILSLDEYIRVVLNAKHFYNIFKYLLFDQNTSRSISNDYIEQSNERYSFSNEMLKIDSSLNSKKLYFLDKIYKISLNDDYNIYYLHGPLDKRIVSSSEKYIKHVNNLLTKHFPNLNVIENPIEILPKHIGDAADHVLPLYKSYYTKKIYNRIMLRIESNN